MTRKARVLAALTQASRNGRVEGEGWRRTCDDGWVDGHVLCRPDLGGSEGLRRLRELRGDGHEIEKRDHPISGRTTRQYRLVERSML